MLEKTNIRSLSQNEIDEIKIVLSILEGYDILDYTVRYTKLPKPRAKYLLRLLEKAGLIYKKEGAKRWRVRVNYFRLWKNAEHVAYKEAETVVYEEGTLKELKELEKKLTSQQSFRFAT